MSEHVCNFFYEYMYLRRAYYTHKLLIVGLSISQWLNSLPTLRAFNKNRLKIYVYAKMDPTLEVVFGTVDNRV